MSQRTTAGAVPSGYRWRDDPFVRWRVATYAALLLGATLAWWFTVVRTRGMDMSMGPGGPVFFMVTWVVMMAAMMFPSVAPMVATYVSIQRGRRARAMPAARGGTACFVGGYLVAWSAAGLLCYALLRAGQVGAGNTDFWQGGRSLGVGLRARPGRGLRADAGEARVPAQVSRAGRVHPRALARRPGRGAADGRGARRRGAWAAAGG